ncbi:helix-turn-helix transcriptional regulator [Cellvibrio sp. ARAG 10.3]|uniref:helix-turn-helix transcriptional regulator n=1 Tax=Cellvibrio sp. ARAG 10.3 TaxID=3451358 RepID=UPI003F47600D
MVNSSNIQNQAIGFYRVQQITELLCISKSTWWLWVQNGRAPKGRKLSPGVTVWNRADIHALIENPPGEASHGGPDSPEAA